MAKCKFLIPEQAYLFRGDGELDSTNTDAIADQMAYLELQNRSPKVEILPDLRLRITRHYDVINSVPKAPTATAPQPSLEGTIQEEWGTADATYTQCLLVKQDVTGQYEENGNNATEPGQKPTKKFPILIRVYEQISATGETKVGDDDTTVDQDGLTTVVQHFLQFSTSVPGITPTFLTVGSASVTSEDGATCVLKSEERTDDGTLQRITRTYISAGLISQDVVSKFDGALVLTTKTYVNTSPGTAPSNGVLVDTKIDHVNGLPVQTYTWAVGTGQISTQTEYRLSPDQGTTGVTVYTIKYISLPSVGSNPISTPSGTEEISVEMAESDGYRLWTAIYAKGQGTIATEISMKLNGNLQETTITAINAAPSTPSASLGGTVELIKTDVRNGTRFEDGTIIYTYTFAEAKGGATGAQIGIDTEYIESVTAGSSGITKTTIEYIVAPGSTVQPTSYGSAVLVKKEFKNYDGYGVWTTIWAIGTGTVLTETTADEESALVIYRVVAINGAPSTPSATIGGTVTVFEQEQRIENGWTVYDYRYAEGNGTSTLVTRSEPDGALIYEVTANNVASATPAYPGSGTAYLVDIVHTNKNGYYVNRSTYKKPPATYTVNRRDKFRLPGTVSIGSGGGGTSLTLVPPVDMDPLVTDTYTFSATQSGTQPFQVKAYCSIFYEYVPTNQPTPKQTVSHNAAQAGYLSASAGNSGTSSNFQGIPCDSWSYTILASTPTSPPSGATTIDVENVPYLYDITGAQIIYRIRTTTYSF